MAGRDLLTTQTYGKPIERSKLQSTIAGNAGNGSFTAEVTRNKWLDHVALEFALEIQNIKRKAEFFSDSPCVINVIQRATTRRKGLAILISVDTSSLIPQLHCETNEIMPL